MLEKYGTFILMHFIILIWGFTGILGKLIHLPPVEIVWFRVIIAAIGIAVALPYLKVSFKLQSKKDLWKLIVVGIFVSLHWVTFYKSIELSTASFGILCLSTTTLHVTWLEPLLMGRKFSPIEFILGLVVIGGIFFVTEDLKSSLPALIYGLVSALFAALFAVGNAKLVETIPSPQISLYEMIVGGVFLTFILLYQGGLNASLFDLRWEDYFWLLFLGIICTSFAFIAIINVVKKLGAFTVSLSINMEPIYTILLAIPILHEHDQLGTRFYFGSLLIIGVVVLNAIIKAKRRKKARLAA